MWTLPKKFYQNKKNQYAKSQQNTIKHNSQPNYLPLKQKLQNRNPGLQKLHFDGNCTVVQFKL